MRRAPVTAAFADQPLISLDVENATESERAEFVHYIVGMSRVARQTDCVLQIDYVDSESIDAEKPNVFSGSPLLAAYII